MEERKRERAEAARIGALLASFLKSTELGRSSAAHALEDAWRRIVGPEIAADTRVVGFCEGRLKVEVKSSALLQELATYHRSSLLDALCGEAPNVGLRDLDFKLGTF
jgi:hypothetical protein